MKAKVLPLLALAALAACDGGTQRDDETAVPAGSAAETSAPTSQLTATASPRGATIPVSIHGRWGLVPADCTSTRGDAKGLLTITANTLEFYESVGTLDDIEEVEPTRVRASFDFEGEGMSWEREIVLDVQDDGATLIRRDYGDEAPPGPFRYAKC